MNFYIDFEALQFSGRIISIGCIADNGQHFYTLCKPSKDGEKVNNFITELTGITNEMLEIAPSSDTAFASFYEWVEWTCGEEHPIFYCYGNSDKEFLISTSKYLRSFSNYVFVNYLAQNMIDYSNTVSRVFACFNRGISLKKVYNLINENEEPQRHNALEDAEMLSTVVRELYNHCTDADRAKLDSMPSTRPAKTAFRNSKAPEKFINWPNNLWEADTGADETNWAYKCVAGSKVKYFPDQDTMVMWAIRYVTQGRSIKKPDDKRIVAKQIDDAINAKRGFMCRRWYRKEDVNE